MKLSIRTKLLLGFILILGLNAVVQLITLENLITSLRTKTGTILSEKAQGGKSLLQTFNSQNRIQLLNLADHFVTIYSSSEQGTFEPFIENITDILNLNNYIEQLSVIGLDAKELIRYNRYSHNTPSEKLNYIIPTHEFDLATQGTTSVSKVFSGDDGITPQVDLYFPVLKDNKPLAVIKAQLSLAYLWDVIAEIKAGTSGFAYVVDNEGRIIAHPDKEFVAHATLINNLPIYKYLYEPLQQTSEPKFFTYQNVDNNPVIASGSQVSGLEWAVIVEQSQEEAFASLNTQRYVTYGTLTAILFLLIGVVLAFTSKVTSSIRKLRLATQSFEKGNLPTHVSITSGDEIEELSHAFNSMVSLITDKINLLESQKLQLKNDAKTLEIERLALVAERNKFSVTIQGITDAIIAINLQGEIILFNDAAQQMCGYSSKTVMGKRLDQYVRLLTKEGTPIPVETYAPIRTDSFEGVVFSQSNIALKSNLPTNKFVDVTSAKITESAGADLACIIRIHDITDKHELQEMQLDFVSMAAHELRTPLTSIRGYLEMLKTSLWGKISDEEQSFIKRIEISSLQLYGLMENLLSASRIERGVFALQEQPTEWTKHIEQAIAESEPLVKEKGLTVKWKKPKKTLPRVLVDPLRINEVLNNLISNAVKYTPQGEVEISVEFDKEKNEVITHIRDTGQGIPPDALPHMFEKFFRVQGTLEQGSKGTGLGLYITRSIVELHQGRIWVESVEGKGSTFSFSLPAEDSDKGR